MRQAVRNVSCAMSSTIESVLQENRIFAPAEAFVRQANISGMDAYRALCAEAERDYETVSGPVPQGTRCAVRFQVIGSVAGPVAGLPSTDPCPAWPVPVADPREVEVALEPGDVCPVEVVPDDDVSFGHERVDPFEEPSASAFVPLGVAHDVGLVVPLGADDRRAWQGVRVD